MFGTNPLTLVLNLHPGEVSRKTRVIDFRLNSLKSAWKSVNRKRGIVD